MQEKVYMHAINSKEYNYFNSSAEIEKLFKILRDDKLKSPRLLGFNEEFDYGFNGLDYISLCDYEKRDLCPSNIDHYNSYYSYVRYGISLAFDKQDLEVVTPILLEPYKNYSSNRKRVKELGLKEERYTDFPDEVQVKDEISMDKLLYITYPVKKYFDNNVYFNKMKKIEALKSEINDIREILNFYNHNNVLIYDIDSTIELNDDGIYKLIMKI